MDDSNGFVYEDTGNTEYREAFLKRFSAFAEGRGQDGGEFFETFISMGEMAFVERYFPEWSCNAEFWKLTESLSDGDFFDLLTAMEYAGRPNLNLEAVYGNVAHRRMFTVIELHYYDLDAGAPYYARSYYDGAYENEIQMNCDFAMEILLRSFTVNESNAGFEEFFSFVGENTAAELLNHAVKEKKFGVEFYFSDPFPCNVSEIEKRVKQRVKAALE